MSKIESPQKIARKKVLIVGRGRRKRGKTPELDGRGKCSARFRLVRFLPIQNAALLGREGEQRKKGRNIAEGIISLREKRKIRWHRHMNALPSFLTAETFFRVCQEYGMKKKVGQASGYLSEKTQSCPHNTRLIVKKRRRETIQS